MEDLEKDKTIDNYLQNLESSLDEEFASKVLYEIRREDSLKVKLTKWNLSLIGVLGIAACLLFLLDLDKINKKDPIEKEASLNIEAISDNPLQAKDLEMLEDLMAISDEWFDIETLRSIQAYELLVLLDS
tara:strand:+ start:755 stop:1144 length:390 start_codon:yes stop_codon:yes gene_type:complete